MTRRPHLPTNGSPHAPGHPPARPGRADGPIAELLAELERLTAERDAAGMEREEYLAALQRERAEFLNFKRRTAEERQASFGLAAESLIGKVLELADDFDRALEARPAAIAADPWTDGVAAIDRKLRALLDGEGVSAIDAAPGAAFDPRSHEAIANVPGTGQPDGTVVAELRRGYRLRDRVIRPALVAVASGGGPASGPSTPPTPSDGAGDAPAF